MKRLIAALLLIASTAAGQTIIDADDIACPAVPFTLYATSDGAATCKYHTSDVVYASMSGTFDGSGTSYHTTTLDLPCAASYIYYVRCDGDTLEATPNALQIHFSVLANSSPTVTVTTNGGLNYNTSATPQIINGTATDDGVVSTVTYTNSLGGSGACTFSTPNFSCEVSMLTGDNLVTITATDSMSATGTDTITVTYTYTPAGTSSRNTVGVKKFSGGRMR